VAGGKANPAANQAGLSTTLPRPPVPLHRPVRADAADYFAPGEVARARSYQRPLRRAGLLASAGVFAVIIAIVFGQAAPRLLGQIPRSPWPLRLLVVVVATSVALVAVVLPFALWEEFVHERRWGFSRVTARLFLVDGIKGFTLGVALLTAVSEALWWLMRLTPWWWLAGAAVVMAVSAALATILPTVLVPLFNRLEPLPAGALRDRLEALAHRAAVGISGYLVMDASRRTTKDNAFFSGMGRTRRIIVFDNLLQMPAEEVEVVVAHEIGHWRRGHLVRQLPVEAAITLLTFGAVALACTWPPLLRLAGVLAISDPAAFPLFLLVYGGLGFAGALVSAWLSRWLEREADLDSLELTRDPAAYRALWRSMTARNLPDLDPSWWRRVRASHPPVAERLALADRWESAVDAGAVLPPD